MTLNEIKKLSRKEFGERYPFVIIRENVKDKDSGEWILKKSYWAEDEPEIGVKKGDPILEFYGDIWAGWSDILLCWAEKVKPIFDQMPKETQDAFYIEQLKEKYGDMRLYTPHLKAPFDKINDYTTMAEHLSTFTCLHCGHLTKSSNGKKLFIWSTRGGWISLYCKKCAKKFMLKMTSLAKEPVKKSAKKTLFDNRYKKIEGKWKITLTRYGKDGATTRVLDSRELFDGMF